MMKEKPASTSATIPLFRYRLAETANATCPFQGRFRSDGWVVFHGTSNRAEEMIERDGFCWKPECYDLAAIKRVTELFDQLYWAGTVHDGYPVLATFTMIDFSRGNGQANKAVYFGETARRCLLYASPYYAGGETAMALRHAFKDLQRYLDDREFRQEQINQSYRSMRGFFRGPVPEDCELPNARAASFEHLRRLWAFYRRKFGYKKPCPADFSEAWLRDRIEELGQIRENAAACATLFTHGVIYAVKLKPEDLPTLTHSAGGVACSTQLPPTRIVAKCIINRDVFDRINPLRIRAGEGTERIDVLTDPASLYARLNELSAGTP